VYLPFCTPVSPPYSLTNLHSFLSHNSSHEIKVLDLNLQFHQLKFATYADYFQSSNWQEYEKIANEYHKSTKEIYAQNNKLVVQGSTPEFYDQLLASIKSEQADIIAFSIVYSSQAFFAHALLQDLDTITVVGGPCVNTKLIELADHHCRNEIELLKLIEKKQISHSNLNMNHSLDFSIYDLDTYFTPHPVIPLKTSTTCYYQQCTFCAHYAQVPYNEYSLHTIEETVVKSGMKHFFLIDDMIPLQRLLKLAALFRKLDVTWACQLRPTKEFTYDVLNTLHASGLTFVLWGVESGCQKILDAIKKGTNVSDVEDVLKNSHAAGITNVTYIMFGFPGESEKDFITTIEFLKRNSEHIDLISTSQFGLQKGTSVYTNPDQYGISEIIENKRTVLDSKIRYVVKDGLSPNEVTQLRKKYAHVIESINTYPKSLNFFREHLFFYSIQD